MPSPADFIARPVSAGAACMVASVIVLGGGSAGFLAALALKVRLPHLAVRVVRSKEIGVIGVGEGSTVTLTKFLHDYLRANTKKLFATAAPTWKLGLKFLWGPRSHFYYTFAAEHLATKLPQLSRTLGFYCDDDVLYDQHAVLMEQGKAFARSPRGGLEFGVGLQYSYHFENERFVRFLEEYAGAVGVEIRDDTVSKVRTGEGGVSELVFQSGATGTADLYLDCSGFASLLLGAALAEPFVSFKSSLFCDRAVVGGWEREPGDLIRPYTTCETMSS